MLPVLNVATYNIHKGFSHFNRRMTVHEMRDRLRLLGADILFLQEVVGHNTRHADRFEDWPLHPQYEFLADKVWTDYAYGKNSVYGEGHHGNAILSRYPIVVHGNDNISTNPLEQRGLLYAEMQLPAWRTSLHCVCLHLGLFARGRRKQFTAVCERIEELVPPDALLIVAGDFNDWKAEASSVLRKSLQLQEVFELTGGRAARSFPAALPVLRLDRIYIRGFTVASVQIHRGPAWARVSDHAMLSAQLAHL
jgi:endonuclease/exonuclease/phosphatase family metal-dependent hydrolase